MVTGVSTRSHRWELVAAVVLTVAGSGLALWATGHAWAVTEVPRPVPLPTARGVQTGRDLVPWAAAVPFVGMAGGLALLATGRTGRRVLGGALLAVGILLVVGGALSVFGETGSPTRIVLMWPVLCLIGGLATATAGGIALLCAHRWDRPMPSRHHAPDAPAGSVSTRAGETGSGETGATWWDALDRGEDPTTR